MLDPAAAKTPKHQEVALGLREGCLRERARGKADGGDEGEARIQQGLGLGEGGKKLEHPRRGIALERRKILGPEAEKAIEGAVAAGFIEVLGDGLAKALEHHA